MTLEARLEEAALAAPPGGCRAPAQVVRNLLENAVRHGREGGRVVLSRSPPGRMAASGPGWCWSVADDGPGIPREHIPRA